MLPDAARCRRVFVFVPIAVIVLAAQPYAYQARQTPTSKQPILRDGFKTWSLFLVTSQDWLVPESATRLRELYDRFNAFGRVIGEEHLAVWFWKKDKSSGTPDEITENVDVERAVDYCKILGLKPSDGPYLVFTTTYPDERTAPVAYQQITLKGMKADDIRLLLDKLGDQLKMEGVVRDGTLQKPPETDDFWSAWFDATRHALADFKSVICFSIRVPSFTIEVGCKTGSVR